MTASWFVICRESNNIDYREPPRVDPINGWTATLISRVAACCQIEAS